MTEGGLLSRVEGDFRGVSDICNENRSFLVHRSRKRFLRPTSTFSCHLSCENATAGKVGKRVAIKILRQVEEISMSVPCFYLFLNAIAGLEHVLALLTVFKTFTVTNLFAVYRRLKTTNFYYKINIFRLLASCQRCFQSILVSKCDKLY